MYFYRKIFLIIFSFITVSFLVLLPNLALADTVIDSFLGFDTSSPQGYVNSIYRYGVSLIAVLATAGIVYGGFRYLTSAGNEEAATSGKGAILAALSGLVIALLSHMILKQLDPRLVDLRLTMPEVDQPERQTPTNSRGLHCSEAADRVLTSGDPGVARSQCEDVCDGNVEVFEESSEPGNDGSGRTDVTSYCCGCGAGSLTSCPSSQETIPDSTEESGRQGWCNEHCLIGEVEDQTATVRTHTNTETEEDIVCCHCERIEDPAETGEPAGSERGCLLQGERASRENCSRNSGTNGTCNHNPGSGCTWDSTDCSSSSDCAGPEGIAGEGHCWDGRCYQRQLEAGEACNSGGWRGVNEACRSGDCDVRIGGQPSRCRQEPCDGCLDAGGLCSNNEECSSGRCEASSGSSITQCRM